MLMKLLTKRILILILLLSALTIHASAQITGVIIDAATKDSIPYASASYKGNHIAVSSNGGGKYSVERHEGWYLTFSAVGYQPQRILVNAKTPDILNIRLKPDTRRISEVVVKAKRKKYSRKENPAVELMRRVIAAKKHTDLNNHDYYQYNLPAPLVLAKWRSVTLMSQFDGVHQCDL